MFTIQIPCRLRAVPFALAAATALSTAFPLHADAPTPDIAAIEAAAARFADVEVALAEGYIPDPSGHCVSAEAEGLPAEWGGMGFHYIHPGRLGITGAEPRVDGNGLNTDFLTPSIMLYEPQADGSLVLVGVENLVFEATWRAAGNADAPTFGERGWGSPPAFNHT